MPRLILFAAAALCAPAAVPGQDGPNAPPDPPVVNPPVAPADDTKNGGGGDAATEAALAEQAELRVGAEAEVERAFIKTAAELYPDGLPVRPGDTLTRALKAALDPAGLTALPDVKALAIDGINLDDVILDRPPAVPPGPATLATVLGLLLDSSGEDLTVRNAGGVLLVTTIIEAENILTARVYNVTDLVTREVPRAVAAGLLRPGWDGYEFVPPGTQTGGGGGGIGGFSLPQDGGEIQDRGATTVIETPDGPAEVTARDAESVRLAELILSEKAWEPVRVVNVQPLIDVLVSTTGGPDAGGDWEENGGYGTIEEFRPDGDAGEQLLVVRQTDAVHRQIAALLAAMRQAGKPVVGTARD